MQFDEVMNFYHPKMFGEVDERIITLQERQRRKKLAKKAKKGEAFPSEKPAKPRQRVQENIITREKVKEEDFRITTVGNHHFFVHWTNEKGMLLFSFFFCCSAWCV